MITFVNKLEGTIEMIILGITLRSLKRTQLKQNQIQEKDPLAKRIKKKVKSLEFINNHGK